MFYGMSCEEHKYLAGLRREKESFERLIKERGVRILSWIPLFLTALRLVRQSMLMPILDGRRSGSSAGDAIIRTISTRIAGGGKVATAEPSQVQPYPVDTSFIPDSCFESRSLSICVNSGLHFQTCSTPQN